MHVCQFYCRKFDQTGLVRERVWSYVWGSHQPLSSTKTVPSKPSRGSHTARSTMWIYSRMEAFGCSRWRKQHSGFQGALNLQSSKSSFKTCRLFHSSIPSIIGGGGTVMFHKSCVFLMWRSVGHNEDISLWWCEGVYESGFTLSNRSPLNAASPSSVSSSSSSTCLVVNEVWCRAWNQAYAPVCRPEAPHYNPVVLRNVSPSRTWCRSEQVEDGA